MKTLSPTGTWRGTGCRIVTALAAFAIGFPVGAQQTSKSPAKPDDGSGLPLPGPPAPQTVKNPDGSTTRTSPWGKGTESITTDASGTVLSSVIQYPTYNGGKVTKVDTGNTYVTVESDSHGTIRHLEKMDRETMTKKVFEYDEKGQLQKALVYHSKAAGGEELQEVYDLHGTRSGYPEKLNKDNVEYNKAHPNETPKNEFEPVKGIAWNDALNRLNKDADEIKSVRDKFALPEKDELEEVRMEAAKQPMGEEPEPPDRPGSEGSAAPLSPPKPREGLALPSNPLVFDPCLLGTWEATSYNEASTMYTIRGGTGFRVTFTKDEQGLIETVDYSKMQEVWVGDDRDPVRYRGSATARIKAKDGLAQVDQMQNAGATWNYRKIKPLRFSNLGPGGLGTVKGSTNYVCDGDTLEYQTSTARDGHANCKVKLTRIK